MNKSYIYYHIVGLVELLRLLQASTNYEQVLGLLAVEHTCLSWLSAMIDDDERRSLLDAGSISDVISELEKLQVKYSFF